VRAPAQRDRERTRKIVEAGTLLRLGDDPPTLDPHLTTDATSAVYVVELFGGLATIDPKLEIVPDLAEKWDLSDGGKTYTFHLRRDAKFHNGKPVTAQDIKWSLERAADPATKAPVVDTFLGDVVGVLDKLRGRATQISGIRVIDDQTLTITTDAPKAYFLSKLTHPNAFVLDRQNVEGNRSWLKEPNGTGPFKLAEYKVGEVLRLQRNERYHLGPPKLKEVQFILGGGDPLLMYENDEIHLAGVGLFGLEQFLDPSHPLNRDLQKGLPRFSVDYIGMNVTKPPFDDLKVRQALNYAIDKDLIARELFQEALLPARSILPPGFPGYNPDLKAYPFDPEKARKLLKESRYGGDLEKFPSIVLTVPGSLGATVGSDLEVILEMWNRNLGIEVEIQQTEWATFLQDLNQLRFQMFGGMGWIADYPDPENFLDILFHTGSSNNQTGYTNPELDRLLEQARVEQDQKVRYGLYHRAEEIILEDASWIPLWYGISRYVLVKSYVKDYFLVPLVVPILRYVYMVEE